MKSRRRWILVVLALSTFSCAPLTPQPLLELSEREGQFYRELHPALVQAQDTFRITADALTTSTANRKAAMMRREAASEREAIYESLVVPDPPKETVDDAIGKLVSNNLAVQTMVVKEQEAAQIRIQAIVKTFEALDLGLGAIADNQKAIHSYLEARSHLIGGPGKSALLPFKDLAELRDYLRQTIKDLQDQFKLAKELMEAAKDEFSKKSEP